MRFDDTARFTPAPSAHWRELDGRAFVLDGATGDHFETNAVGGRIFTLAAEGQPVAAIRDAVVAEFAVARPAVDDDLQSYLAALVDGGLLQVAGDVPRR